MGKPEREKVIVAVHGIGDQVRYETVQMVARQFCRYVGVEGAIPLGRLYGALTHDRGAAKGYFRFFTPPDPEMPGLGLAEVYWADIPRISAQDGYILEETKAWTKTIVERLRSRQRKRLDREMTLMDKVKRLPRVLFKKAAPGLELTRIEFKTIKHVLTEIIETVSILTRLVGWLERLTRFKFPLKKILVDYVDDVQIVTEYPQLRRKILDEFHDVMKGICSRSEGETGDPPDIYIVAHSEGTVISLLALLEALDEQSPFNRETKSDRGAWVANVRGFMTLGSPIDKHLILWPELWRPFEGKAQWRRIETIKWFNYYDFGDPVGFRLDTARRWIGSLANTPPILLDERNDIGFSRYVFPGKAHVDYWRDDVLFRHFIENVGGFEKLVEERCKKKKKEKSPRKIVFKGRRYVAPLSATIPYLLVICLCTLGTWFLYRATAGAAKIDACNLGLAWNVGVLGVTLSLATAAAQIPWLARGRKFFVLATGLLAVATLLVSRAPTETLLQTLGTGLQEPKVAATAHAASVPDTGNCSSTENCCCKEPSVQKRGGSSACVTEVKEAVKMLGFGNRQNGSSALSGFLHPLVFFNFAIILASWGAALLKPKWGKFPMLIVGAAGVVCFVLLALRGVTTVIPLWPAVVAGVGFIYFWWLAALVFDLSFVWHRYICMNTGIEHMEELASGEKPAILRGWGKNPRR